MGALEKMQILYIPDKGCAGHEIEAVQLKYHSEVIKESLASAQAKLKLIRGEK